MEKAKAIEILNKEYDDAIAVREITRDSPEDFDYLNDLLIALLTVIDVLEQSSDIEAEPEKGWISVKDRLPEEEQKVLCVTCDEEIVIAEFSHFSYDFGRRGEWHYWGIRPPEFVTHWQPLPTPPKEDNNEIHKCSCNSRENK